MVTLLEIDNSQAHSFFTTHRAFVWWVNFNKIYPDIAPEFLNGVPTYSITNVGSVTASGIRLKQVSSVLACQQTRQSFYYDSASKSLYVQCPAGNDPTIFTIKIGVSFGFRLGGEISVYNNFVYTSRVKSIPSITTKKDPSFYGISSYSGGTVTCYNEDGYFDRFGIDVDLFGNDIRLLVGEDGDDYNNFEKIFSGRIGSIGITETEFSVEALELKAFLLKSLPINFYNAADYPTINPRNEGKPIPVGWGSVKNIPVICIDEMAPAPASYTFKIVDMLSYTSIGSIDDVYVDGVSIVPLTTDLATAEFTLDPLDYNPGDDVTCDCTLYEDALGNLIDNGADIISEILKFSGVGYTGEYYNYAKWDRATANSIGIFITKISKTNDVITKILTDGILGYFQSDPAGRYVLRIFNRYQPALGDYDRHDYLDVPQLEYDPSEIISTIRVGYDRDWSADEFIYLIDASNEYEASIKYKISDTNTTFDTLTSDSVCAQKYADTIMFFSGDAQNIVKFKTTFGKSKDFIIGDFINLYLDRPVGQFIEGVGKYEIISKTIDLNTYTIDLVCRLIDFVYDSTYITGSYYNDCYYNDNYYGITFYQED